MLCRNTKVLEEVRDDVVSLCRFSCVLTVIGAVGRRNNEVEELELRPEIKSESIKVKVQVS